MTEFIEVDIDRLQTHQVRQWFSDMIIELLDELLKSYETKNSDYTRLKVEDLETFLQSRVTPADCRAWYSTTQVLC